MFLLVPFAVMLIHFINISIFKMNNNVFWPKGFMSSRLKHVRANCIKFYNNVVAGGTLCSKDEKKI